MVTYTNHQIEFGKKFFDIKAYAQKKSFFICKVNGSDTNCFNRVDNQ